MNKKFGKLEKVDLSKLWNGESTDFTAWLSQEENIADLGSAVGMELEIQEKEEKAGVFQADILCKDVLTDHFVLIENQLEKTDHTHLGQIMTYAAGLEAVTIIWIAKSFAEEHWAALDWLNNITDESINFFGVEIEAYKIGDSLPAPNFTIIVKPNDWTKQAKKTTSKQKITDIKLLQQEYWSGLKEFMEANKSFVKMPNPPTNSWFNIPIGKNNYFFSPRCQFMDNSINLWLTIIGAKSKEDFDRLYEIAYKDSLTEVNQNLIWDRMQETRDVPLLLKSYATLRKSPTGLTSLHGLKRIWRN
jgi:hypothetical protein